MLDKYNDTHYIMIVMKLKRLPRIKINWQARRSYVRYADDRYIPGNPFVTKDGWHFYHLSISRYGKHRGMAFCHELGHILLCRRRLGSTSKEHDIFTLRSEVEAWRLAKSFVLPQYWDEQEALNSIKGHAKYFPNWAIIFDPLAQKEPIYARRKECFDRLKVIPWNQGISLKP